ncbi:hypothetical protein GYMLUDRAFT_251969 [Collybiopsis luxurians FD-317 M1]|uniref:DNA 3'-5' helicase n=1 Tax=Collybiopsis luxurians FD-317 M1 TaxID=944289 RepID=A0A0D0C1I0_9AGAR|nr:hypothetical protein GYMLUDRAFT_251969 [Collybiopsis luxurians FD-317 M1]
MATPSNLPHNLQHTITCKKQQCTQKANHSASNTLKPLSDDDLESLDEDVKQMFHKNFILRDFQKEAARAQLQQKDTIVHAHTGAGKTAIVAAPHAHPSSKGKITFLVSPLIALQDEQAETFRDKYNLMAIAINSSHGGLTATNVVDICARKYQIVVVSPEMMLTQRFTASIIKNKHVKYGELGVLRTFLPDGIPFVALSATLPPRVRDNILLKLQFPKEGYVNINIGNDRPNVSLVVRAIQHPMNTYKDLDFLVSPVAKNAISIPKTFVYSDDIPSGPEIVDHLEELLPEDLWGLGLVRPFSAAFSKTYRKATMKQFKAGIIRVLVCTDAAGMGCNIPDVNIIVQWKLPATLSMLIQCTGHAACARSRKGLAVLLVEKGAYSLDCESVVEKENEKSQKGNGKGRTRTKSSAAPKQRNHRERAMGTYEKGLGKGFAEAKGVNRGSYGGRADNHSQAGWEPTGHCRRRIWTSVYGNKEAQSVAGVDCCDICQPHLLHQTRPGLHKVCRAPAIPKGEPYRPAIKALYEWHTRVHKADHSTALWSPQAILSNELAVLLASVGPISSIDDLNCIVGEQWAWWDQYSMSLWEAIQKLSIPPIAKTKTKKRNAAETEDAGNDAELEGERQSNSRPAEKRT